MSTDTYLDTMLEAYLTAAEWTAPDEDGEERSHPGGEFVSMADRDAETVATARQDCTHFYLLAASLLSEWTADQAGHDFWLTRNGHGTGFWDRGKAHGDALSQIAQDLSGETTEWVDSVTGVLYIDARR